MTSSRDIERHACELAWSLWTELGMPGVVRHHSSCVVDPEPLLVVTPVLARSDERLLDEALRWWREHADRLSVSRLAGLSRSLATRPRERFVEFSARRDGAPRATALAVHERAPVRLPVERPSLLRFRVRALVGVGARADVLSHLLLHARPWTSAAEVARSGYAKRTVARILIELADAGVVARRAVGNSLRFRLNESASLAALVSAAELAEPPWWTVFDSVLTLLELVGQERKAAGVRRVAAHQARESLAEAAAVLDWPAPPPTRGAENAWDLMLEWGSQAVERVASGDVS